MSQVRIYRPSRNTMQAGLGHTHEWVIEPELETARHPENLMGWTSAGDTDTEVRLSFPTLEAAQEFAQSQGWEYTVLPAHNRKLKPRNYVDNFKYRPPASQQG